MGGMGFIETHKAECMLSVLVSTHMLVAAKEAGTERFFYSSSTCVYNGEKQTRADVTALKEEDAYPAMPEDGRLGPDRESAGSPSGGNVVMPRDADRPRTSGSVLDRFDPVQVKIFID
jgi:hypothetical protein